MSYDLRTLIDQTPIVDSHEHLLEEPNRLKAGGHWRLHDIGVFFTCYLDSDLQVAGMPKDDFEALIAQETPLDRKWALVKPWWPKIRQTGYGLMARESLRALFDEDDFTDESYARINEKLGALIRPGYYRTILRDVCNIDHCQVNSLEYNPFCETTQPDLLLQDLSTVALSTDPNVGMMCEQSGMQARDLDEWYAIIDWAFATYGPRAVAVKNQSAYQRALDYERVSKEDAASLFAAFLADHKVMPRAARRPLEDHLFHYTVEKAAEYGLPVKLHTGYYAGQGYMPLHRLRRNGGDMCRLCMQHPTVPFVFMHIAYPYQDEAIAVAKHFPNAYVDMCWAWIINPAAGVRFLKEFLMAAPANKLLVFGADVGPVELVPGHARIARRGIAQALQELLHEGWLRESDVPELVEMLLRGNAYDLFDVARSREQAALATTYSVDRLVPTS